MPATLNDSQMEDTLDALSDAQEYRLGGRWRCGRCADGLCDDHKAEARKAIRYANLERSLRKAAGHG